MKRVRPSEKSLPETIATENPDFVKEARRQSRVVSQADRRDKELQKFMDDALDDLEDPEAF